MSIRLTKPWEEVAGIDPASIPGQLGVFQLASSEQEVVYIGYAGGRQPFGLRSALPEAVKTVSESMATPPTLVRYELTHGYMSRWEELMMIHVYDHGDPPPANDPLDTPRGRIFPGPPEPPFPSTPASGT